MSPKYIAWDGQEYDWPPPEGWVQEVDGRWWPNQNQIQNKNQQTHDLPNDDPGLIQIDPWNETQQSIPPSETNTPKSNKQIQLDLNDPKTAILLGGAVSFFSLLFIVLIWSLLTGSDEQTLTPATTPSSQTTVEITTTTTIPIPYSLVRTQESKDNFIAQMKSIEIETENLDIEAQGKLVCDEMNKSKTRIDYEVALQTSVDLTVKSFIDKGISAEDRPTDEAIEKSIIITLTNLCPTVAQRLNVTPIQ